MKKGVVLCKEKAGSGEKGGKKVTLEVVQELAATTFVNIDLGNSVLLIKLVIIGLLKHVKVNVMRFKAPALVINQKTAIVFLVGVGQLPAIKLGHIDLGTLFKVIGSNADIRTKSRTISYEERRECVSNSND